MHKKRGCELVGVAVVGGLVGVGGVVVGSGTVVVGDDVGDVEIVVDGDVGTVVVVVVVVVGVEHDFLGKSEQRLGSEVDPGVERIAGSEREPQSQEGKQKRKKIVWTFVGMVWSWEGGQKEKGQERRREVCWERSEWE